MFKSIYRANILVSVCLSAFYASGASAEAADANPAFDAEDIVVTAQKREQSLQDVGLAITAVSGVDVKAFDLKDVLRLSTVTPGLTAVDGSAGQPTFRIRGIGINEFSAAFDGPVGVHVDEIFLAKPILSTLGFFDVKRVEVLKGPQGTVFGRNTIAGAVNYYSNTPSDKPEFGLNASYGTYGRFNAEAYASGPITDSLSARLAIQRIQNGAKGPYFNLYNNKYLGHLVQNRIRGTLEWKGDSTKVTATADYGSKVGDLPAYGNGYLLTPNGVPVVNNNVNHPFPGFVVNSDYWQTTDTHTAGGTVRIEQTTPIGTITALTGYRDFKRENREDTDNTPIPTVNIDWNSKLKSFSQELRLGGKSGIWTYLIGAYYENTKITINDVIDLTDLAGTQSVSDYAVNDHNYAIFANNEFALTDQLAVILGARYTSERQHITGEAFNANPGVPRLDFDRIAAAYRQNVVVANATRKDTAFNYKVGLNYAVNDDALLFASYTTGFRSGGFDFLAGGGNLLRFNPERAKAAELGFKTSWMGGRLIFNGSAFFEQVRNYQETVNQITEITPRRRNAGTVETKGFEAELKIRPDDHFKANLGIAYTDAKIVKSNLFIGSTPLKGTLLINSPKLALNGLLNYTAPIGYGLLFDGAIIGKYQSSRYLEPDNEPSHKVPSFTTVDVNLSVLTDDKKWRFTVWGKNVFDKKYLVYINDIPALQTFLTVNGDPATFGVSVDLNF